MDMDPGCYESHLTLLDDPAGQRIAECMSEGWATRAAVLLSAFEAQTNGAWCALAASVIALRTINYAAEGLILVPTQRELHDEYVHANGLQGGVSLSELDAILRLVSEVRCASALQVEFHPGHDKQQTLSSLYSDLLLAEQDGSVLPAAAARGVDRSLERAGHDSGGRAHGRAARARPGCGRA